MRGKRGGYRLGKTPKEISLGAVLRAVEGELFDSPALEDEACPAELRGAWAAIRAETNKAADSITFDTLLEARGLKQEMYYI